MTKTSSLLRFQQ